MVFILALPNRSTEDPNEQLGREDGTDIIRALLTAPFGGLYLPSSVE